MFSNRLGCIKDTSLYIDKVTIKDTDNTVSIISRKTGEGVIYETCALMINMEMVTLKRLILPKTGSMTWNNLDFELDGKTNIGAAVTLNDYTDVSFSKIKGNSSLLLLIYFVRIAFFVYIVGFIF